MKTRFFAIGFFLSCISPATANTTWSFNKLMDAFGLGQHFLKPDRPAVAQFRCDNTFRLIDPNLPKSAARYAIVTVHRVEGSVTRNFKVPARIDDGLAVMRLSFADGVFGAALREAGAELFIFVDLDGPHYTFRGDGLAAALADLAFHCQRTRARRD